MNKSLRDNEHGIAQILLMALVILVVAGVGFAAWRVMSNKSSPKASTTTTTTNKTEAVAATSSCVATYHDSNLCKFASHASLAKIAYSAEITDTSTAGASSTMTLESDGRGDTSLSATSGSQQIDSIEFGGHTYIQNGSTWIEYPSGSSASTAPANPTSGMNLVLGTGISYTPAGTSPCGSLTCFEYKVTDSAQPTATQYAWFDNQQYLLREWKDVDTTSGTTDMTLSYKAVTISAPTPVESYSSVSQ